MMPMTMAAMASPLWARVMPPMSRLSLLVMVVGGPLGSLGGDGSGPARPVQAELAGKGGTAWGTDQGGMF